MSSMTIYAQFSTYEAMQVADALHNAVTALEEEVEGIERMLPERDKGPRIVRIHQLASILHARINSYNTGLYRNNSEKMMQELVSVIQELNDHALTYRIDHEWITRPVANSKVVTAVKLELPDITPIPVTLEAIRSKMTFSKILDAMNATNTVGGPAKKGFKYIGEGIDVVCDTPVTGPVCAVVGFVLKAPVYVASAATPESVKRKFADAVEHKKREFEANGIPRDFTEKTIGNALAVSGVAAIAVGAGFLGRTVLARSALKNKKIVSITTTDTGDAAVASEKSVPRAVKKKKEQHTKEEVVVSSQELAVVEGTVVPKSNKKYWDLFKLQKEQKRLTPTLPGYFPIPYTTLVAKMTLIEEYIYGLGKGRGYINLRLPMVKLEDGSTLVSISSRVLAEINSRRGVASSNVKPIKSNLSAIEKAKYTIATIEKQADSKTFFVSFDDKLIVLPRLKELETAGKIEIIGKQLFFSLDKERPVWTYKIKANPAGTPVVLEAATPLSGTAEVAEAAKVAKIPKVAGAAELAEEAFIADDVIPASSGLTLEEKRRVDAGVLSLFRDPTPESMLGKIKAPKEFTPAAWAVYQEQVNEATLQANLIRSMQGQKRALAYHQAKREEALWMAEIEETMPIPKGMLSFEELKEQAAFYHVQRKNLGADGKGYIRLNIAHVVIDENSILAMLPTESGVGRIMVEEPLVAYSLLWDEQLMHAYDAMVECTLLSGRKVMYMTWDKRWLMGHILERKKPNILGTFFLPNKIGQKLPTFMIKVK